MNRRGFGELDVKCFFSDMKCINFQLTLHLPVKVIGLFFNKYFPLETNIYQLPSLVLQNQPGH